MTTNLELKHIEHTAGKVCIWDPDTLTLLWSNVPQVLDFTAAVRALSTQSDPEGWYPMTFDSPGGGSWRTRWGGRVRYNTELGAVEIRGESTFLEHIIVGDNPVYGVVADTPQLWKRTDCPECLRDGTNSRVGAEMECPGHATQDGPL